MEHSGEVVQRTLAAILGDFGEEAAAAFAGMISFGVIGEPDTPAKLVAAEAYKKYVQGEHIHLRGYMCYEYAKEEYGVHDHSSQACIDYAEQSGYHEVEKGCLVHAQDRGWHEEGEACYEYMREDGWHRGDEDDECIQTATTLGYVNPESSPWLLLDLLDERLNDFAPVSRVMAEANQQLAEIHKTHPDSAYPPHMCPLCGTIAKVLFALENSNP